MTVRKNIAFPLRMAGLSSTEQGKKVEDAAKVLNLSEYLDRKPGQLSGGQGKGLQLAEQLSVNRKHFCLMTTIKS